MTALVTASTATPWGSRANKQCAAYCKETSKFSYAVGTVYTYDYLAEAATQISGTSDEESRVHINAQAEFEVASQCEFILRLKKVTLEDSEPTDATVRTVSPGSAQFAGALEKNPMIFSFQDGQVEHVCPMDGEESWVLNVKRGILSGLQNSMKNLTASQAVYETDISGHCEANYTVTNQGKGVTITRTKNLLACTGRNGHQSPVQATPYSSTSAIQTLPLLKSENECQQIIRNGRLEKSVCTESYLFQPFSNGNSGASTKISQSLTYSSEHKTKEVSISYKSKKLSMLFDGESQKKSFAGRDDLVINILKQMVDESKNGVSSQIPVLFSRLVTLLQPLSYNQIANIFKTTQEPNARKFLMDAAPMVGTAASMAMVRDMIQEGSLSEIEIEMWLSSLAFQTKPTLEMITVVSPMLTETNPRPKAMLSISAMINAYCRTHSECNTDPEILKVVGYLESFIGAACRSVDKQQQQTIVLALKALGNAGVIASSAPALQKCYEEENAMVVRLAAIDAIRRVPCQAIDRGSLLTFFRNMNHDSELRIAAYLAVMRCPTAQILDEIKQSLVSEGVNQVGSFVWTHLTNLQETSSPSKQQIRQMLSSEFLRNKFNTDVRKFSRNVEVSSFWEELNMGGTVESNVIFSSKSYLPKSGMLNLTLDLFGESINLLELGARIEGFESMVESFFGPNGLYPEETIEKALQSIRGKRAVDENSINQLSTVYDVKKQFTDEPSGDVYLRIFGNEVHAKSFKGLDFSSRQSPLAMLLQAARQKDIDFTKSIVFIDASYIVPTMIGLPLNLTVNATSTVKFQMGGKFNVNALSDLEVAGHIKPSVAMEISGIMAVDAFVSRSGVQIQNTMHSSTGVDGKITIKGKELVSVQINSPEQKVDIFHMNSKIFLFHKGEARSVNPTRKVYSRKGCTSSAFSYYLGNELCAEVEFVPVSPNAPSGPLKGSSHVAVYMKKTDVHKQYNFEYKWTSEQVKNQFVRTVAVQMDTPDSKVNRRLSAQLTVDETAKSLRAFFISPVKSAELSGKFEYNELLKGLDVMVTVDGTEYVSMRTVMRTDVKGNAGRYEPSLVISKSGKELVNFQGYYSFVHGSKYGLDFQLKQITARPIRLTGGINKDGDKYDLNIGIKSYALDSAVSATVRSSDKIFATKMKVDYSVFEATSQNLEISSKFNRITKGALQKTSVSAIFQGSQFPGYTSEFMWEFQSSSNYLENNVHISFGDMQFDAMQLYSDVAARGQRDTNVRFSVACPKKNIDFLTSFSQKFTDNLLNSTAVLRTSPGREWATKLELLHKYEPNFYGATVQVSTPNGSSQLRSEMTTTELKQIDAVIEYKSDKKIEAIVTATFKNASTDIKLDYLVELKARGASIEDINFETALSSAATTSLLVVKGQYGARNAAANIEYNRVQDTQHVINVVFDKNDANVFKTLLNIDLNQRTSVSLDIQAGRRITMDFKFIPDGKTLSTNMDIFWDKDRDENQSFVLVGKLDGSAKGNAVLKYSGKTVVVMTDFTGNNLRTEIEWAADQKIVLDLNFELAPSSKKVNGKLTTPYTGFEQISFDALHNLANGNLLSQLTTSWNEDTMTFSVNGTKTTSNVKGAINFKSTFDKFQDSTLGFDTVTRNEQKRFQLYAVHAGRQSKIILSYNVDKNRFTKGVLQVVTPFAGYETLTATVIHDQQTDAFDSKAKFQGPFKHEVVFGLSGKKTMTETVATIGVTSTLEAVKTASASFQFTNTADGKKLYLTSEFNGQRSVFDASGAVGKSKIEAGLLVTSPFTNEIVVSLQHKSADVFSTKANVSWAPEKKMELIVEGEIKPNLIVMNCAFATSSAVSKARLEHKMIAGKLMTVCEAEFNGKKMLVSVDAESQIGKNASMVRINSGLSLPFAGLDDAKFIVNYKRNGMDIITRVELSKQEQIVVLEHIFTTTGPLNWQNVFVVSTPFNGLTSLRSASKQSSSAGNVKHETDVDINGKKMTAMFDWSAQNYQTKSTGSFVSSWTEDFTFQLEHTDNEVQFHPVLVIRTGSATPVRLEVSYKRGPLNPSLTFELASAVSQPIKLQAAYNNAEDVKNVVATLSWNADETINLNVDWMLNQASSSAKMLITTTLAAYPTVGAEFKYDLAGRRKTAFTSLAINDRKVQMDAFADAGETSYQAEVIITTPFASFESIKGTAIVDMANTRAGLKYQRGTYEITLQGSMAFEASQTLVTAVFNSPIAGFENIIVDASLESNSKAQLNIDFNGKKMSFEGTYVNVQGKGTVAAAISTPFEGHSSSGFDVQFDFSAPTKSAWLTMKKNDATIEANMHGNFGASSGTFTASLKAPCCSVGNVDISGSYTKSTERKIVQLKLNYNGTQSEVEASILKKKNMGEMSVKTVTNFKGFENMSFYGQYDASDAKKNAFVTMIKNSDKIEATAIVNSLNLQRFDGSFEMSSTMDSLKSLRLAAKYDVSVADKSAEFAVSRNENKAKLFIGGAITRLQSRIESRFESTYAGYENILAELLFNLEGPKKVVSIISEKNGHRNIFSGQLEMKDNNKVHIRATTPFAGFETMSASGDYALGAQQSRVTFQMERNGKKEINFNGHFDLIKNEAAFELKTLVADFEIISAVSKWNLGDKQKSFDFRFVRNQSTYQVQLNGSFSKKQSELIVNGRTSIQGWESFSANVAYDVQADVSASMNLEKNGGQTFSAEFILTKQSAKLSVVTPYEGLRSLGFTGQVNTESETKMASINIEKEGTSKQAMIVVHVDKNSALVNLETPFQGYEKMSVNVRFDFEKPQKTFGVIVRKNEDKMEFTASVAVTATEGEVDLKLSSTLPQWEKLMLVTRYDLSGASKSFNSKLFINDQTAELNVGLNLDSRNIQTNVQLMTPLTGYQQLSFNADVQLVDNKMVLAAFENSGKRYEFSGSLAADNRALTWSFKTPLPGYEMTSFSGRVDNRQIDLSVVTPLKKFAKVVITADYELSSGAPEKFIRLIVINGQARYESQIVAKFGPTFPSFADLTLRVQLPFVGFENFATIVKYNVESQEKTFMVAVEKSQNRYEASLNIAKTPSTDSKSNEVTIRLHTPFFGYEEIDASVAYDLEAKSFVFVVERNGQSAVRLNAVSKLAAASSNVALSLTMPSLLTKEINFSAFYKMSQDLSEIEAHVKFGKTEVRASGKHNEWVSGSGAVSTTFQKFKELQVNWNLAATQKTAELTVSMNDKVVKASLDSRFLSQKNVTVRASLSTPFFGDYSLNAEWNAVNKDKVVGKVEYKTPQNTFATTLMGKYGPQSMNAEMVIKTSLPKFEEISVSGRYASIKDISAESTIQWSGDRKITVSLTKGQFSTLKSATKINVTTPFTMPMLVDGQYNLMAAEKSARLLYTYGVSNIKLEANMPVISPAKTNAKITFMTPKTKMTVIAKYDLTGDKKDVLAMFDLNDKKTELRAVTEKTADRVTLVSSLSSQTFDINRWRFEGFYDKSNGLNCSATITWAPTKSIRAGVQMRSTAFVTTLSTPFAGYEKIEFYSTFDFDGADQKFAGTATWNDKKINLTSSWKIVDQGLQFFFQIFTPFEDFRDISFKGSYGSNAEYAVTLTYSHGGKKIDIEGKMVPSVEGKGKMIFAANEVSFAVEYDLSLPQKSAAIVMERGTKRYSMSAVGQMSDLINGYIAVETPSMKPVKFAVELDVNSVDKLAKITLETEKGKIEIIATGAMTEDESKFNLAVSSPFSGFQNVIINSQLNGKSFDFYVQYDTNSKIQLKGDYRFTPSVISISTTLETPFEQLEKISLTSQSYSEGPKGFSSSSSVQWSADKTISFSALMTPFDYQVAIQTPYELLLNGKISTHYQWKAAEKAFKLAAEYNSHQTSLEGNMVNDQQAKGFYVSASFNQQTISLESLLKYETDKLTKFNVKMVTPFEGLSNLAATFEVEKQTANKMEYRVTVETPFKNFPSSKLTVQSNIESKRRYEMTAVGSTSSYNMVAKTMFSINGKTHTVAIDLDAPFIKSLPSFSGRAEIQAETWKDVAVTASAVMPDGEYTTNGSMVWSQSDVNVSGAVKTPAFAKSIELGGAYNSNDDLVQGEMFVWGNKLQGRMLKQGQQMKTEMSLDVPDMMIPTIRFNTDVNYASAQQFQAAATLMSGPDSHTMSVLYQLADNKLTLDTTLESPLVQSKKALSIQINNGGVTGSGVEFVGKFVGNDVYEMTGRFQVGESVNVKLNAHCSHTALDVDLAVNLIQGKWSVVYNQDSHHVDYQINKLNGYSLIVNTDSPFIQPTKIRANLNTNAEQLMSSLAIQYGQDAHEMNAELWSGAEQKSASVKLSSPMLPSKEAAFDGKYALSNQFEAEVNITVLGDFHHFATVIENNSIFNAVVRVESALLPWSSVVLAGKADYQTNNNQAEASVIYGGKIMKLAANVNYNHLSDFEGIVTLSTPFLPEARLDAYVNGTHGMDARFEIQSPTSEFTKTGVTLKYWTADNKLNTVIGLTTAIENWQTAAIEMSIPLDYQNSEISASLALPTARYGFTGRLDLAETRLESVATLDLAGQKYSADLVLAAEEVYEARLVVKTPIPGYENYSWNVRGQANVKHWGEATAFLDWNDSKIEFSSNVKAEPSAYVAIVQLKTPFVNYERYGVQLRLEGTERKTFHIELESAATRVGADFDYLFNSNTDFVCKASINTPFKNYESFTIQATNRWLESSYVANLEAIFVNYGVSMNVNYVFRADGLEASLQGRFNDQVIALAIKGDVKKDKIEGKLNLKTPFEAVKSVEGFVAYENNGTVDNKGFGISLNGRQMIDASLVSKDGTYTLKIDNPWSPMDLSFSMESGQDLINYHAQVCWNLNSRADSTLGGTVTVKNTSYGKQVHLQTQAPKQSLSIAYAMELTSTKLNHTASVSWTEGKSVGYKILLENASTLRRTQLDAVLRLDTPVRSFEFESHKIASNGDASTSAEFKWDALGDRSKRMGARIETGPSNLWKVASRQTRITLIHSGLQQDIVIATNYLNDQDLKAKFDLTYSPSEDHRFTIEASKTYENNKLRSLVFSVRHPVSQVNVRLTSDLLDKTDMTSLVTRVDYQDRLNASRFMQLTSKVFKMQRQVDLELKTVDHLLFLSNAVQKSANSYTITSKTILNDLDMFTLQGKVDMSQPTMKMDASYAAGKTFNLYAGMPSKRQITFRATRDVLGKTITDGHLDLKLNKTDVLSSRLYWRAASWTELRQIAASSAINMLATSETTVNSMVAFVSQEMSGKREMMMPIAEQIYSRVYTDVQSEIKAISLDFVTVTNYVAAAYENNDFYLQNIAAIAQEMITVAQPYFGRVTRNLVAFKDALIGETGAFYEAMKNTYAKLSQVSASVCSKLSSFVSNTVVDASRHYSNVTVTVIRAYQQFEMQINEMMENAQAMYETYYGNMEEIVMQKYDLLRMQVVAFGQSYAETMRPYMKYFDAAIVSSRKYINDVKKDIEDSFNAIQAKMMTYEPIQKMAAFYHKYASWLEEFHTQDRLERIGAYAKKVAGEVEGVVKAWLAAYRPVIDPLVQAFNGQMESIQQLPVVMYLNTIAQRIQLQVSDLNKHLELEVRARNVFRQALQQIDKMCVQLAKDLKGALDFPWRPVFVWEPEFGRIEFTQKLPIKWESFNELPQLNYLPFAKKAETAQKNLLRQIDFSGYYYDLVDIIATYRNTFDVKKIIPPFGSHAMIAGTQHYMTFDKKFFEFAGECSYLLVSDFFNNNFSVVVNYEATSGKVTRKSLTVISDGRQIEIDSTFRVTLNKRFIEMPLVFNKTSITRDGARVIINNENGYNVDCNLFRDVCTVKVSGWSFGKTGGLFGTFNNEPSDDFLTPYRQQRTDQEIDSFAASWKVGTSRCRVSNLAVNNQAASPRNARLCDELFADEASVLQPCFRHVDVTPFKRMCLNDLATYENSPKKELGVCTAASAYVRECQLHDIDLFVPSKCVRCELEDGHVMTSGEIKSFENNAPRSADVVFIVDQKSCLKNTRLSSLPMAIDSALKERGINQSRFAVVGFGGKNIHEQPHIHTAGGQIWSTSKNIQATLEDIPFDGDKKADIFAALRYAINLPFRAGVSKQIVLTSCASDCEASGYADALTLLIENDIKMHLLQPRDLTVKRKSTSDEFKYVFGFDAEQVFTVRNVRSMKGDRELRRHLVIPKDFCTPLALETNGALFDLKKMTTDNGPQAKKFIDVFARRFATTANPSECQRCDCIGDRDGIGSILCQRCESPILERFTKHWEQLVYENELENSEIVSDIQASAKLEKPIGKVIKKRNE